MVCKFHGNSLEFDESRLVGFFYKWLTELAQCGDVDTKRSNLKLKRHEYNLGKPKGYNDIPELLTEPVRSTWLETKFYRMWFTEFDPSSNVAVRFSSLYDAFTDHALARMLVAGRGDSWGLVIVQGARSVYFFDRYGGDLICLNDLLEDEEVVLNVVHKLQDKLPHVETSRPSRFLKPPIGLPYVKDRKTGVCIEVYTYQGLFGSNTKVPTFLSLFGLDVNYQGIKFPFWVCIFPVDAYAFMLDLYTNLANLSNLYTRFVYKDNVKVGVILSRSLKVFDFYFHDRNE